MVLIILNGINNIPMVLIIYNFNLKLYNLQNIFKNMNQLMLWFHKLLLYFVIIVFLSAASEICERLIPNYIIVHCVAHAIQSRKAQPTIYVTDKLQMSVCPTQFSRLSLYLI